ncbi:MAG: cobalamin biosynthesis protein CbiD [Lachnospiraceae bacterium]|nr:cobalamin biosynthesis protein CbiD [Lachnospiraceae bacterium]
MHESGIEAYYTLKDGKKLYFGYTTGTCAAAAAKAATILLLRGRAPETVHILTPKGIALDLAVLEPTLSRGTASCAIRKYSGDDPDVTNGILVYAAVQLRPEQGIVIDGGLGVGRVTKPGLKEPVGEAAINPVPREMIKRAAEEALDECGEMTGLDIVISVPEGVEIAKKTFNPRLGIVGGISILGTSGIVEPMSEEAMIESIELEIRQKKALGEERLIISPGNYGTDFAKTVCQLDESRLVKCSNYIGRTLDMAVSEGYREVLLIGQIGKLVKLSGGIMNTHSREGDGRAELMAAFAIRAGADAELARAILDCVMTEEMLRLMHDRGIMERAMRLMGERIDYYVRHRIKDQISVGVVVFHETYGILCTTGPAAEWIEEMRKQNEET